MQVILNRIKDLEFELKNQYQEIEALSSNEFFKHRELLNKIRYNEAKVHELKIILKFEKSMTYHQV